MKKHFIFKIIICFALILTGIFSFASCETTYNLSQVVVRLNNVTNNEDISKYFTNGTFKYDVTAIQQKVGDNELLETQAKVLNSSMMIFNKFKTVLEGNVAQKEASKESSTTLYKQLEAFYTNLREQHIAKLSIENNANFNISNTQDKNEFEFFINKLMLATNCALDANITIISILDDVIYSKINILNVKDPSLLTWQIYEAKILKAYVKMLKNAANVFLDNLKNEKLFVYGSDNNGFESLSDILNLSETLERQTPHINASLLEKMQQITPNLNYVDTVFEFTKTSINNFNFKSLVSNVKNAYTNYNAINVTRFLNSNVSNMEKANYNFVVQEMQNYKNICAMIKNLFY